MRIVRISNAIFVQKLSMSEEEASLGRYLLWSLVRQSTSENATLDSAPSVYAVEVATLMHALDMAHWIFPMVNAERRNGTF